LQNPHADWRKSFLSLRRNDIIIGGVIDRKEAEQQFDCIDSSAASARSATFFQGYGLPIASISRLLKNSPFCRH
jgi:hypothetical protein